MTTDFHLTQANKPYLIERINALDPYKHWVVTIRERSSKRSNQQNSLYWLFLQGFGRHLGYTSEEMHELCKYKFLSEHVMIGGKDMVKLKSTPKTTTKEFAEYYEMCVMWAATLGYVFDDFQA